MEIIDLSSLENLNKALLRAAVEVFDDAYAVQTPRSSEPSQVMNRSGRVIALGWFDKKGDIMFRPMISKEHLN